MVALSLSEVMDVQADGCAAPPLPPPVDVLQERSNIMSAPDPQNKAVAAQQVEAQSWAPVMLPPPLAAKLLPPVASQSLEASDSDPFGIRPARGCADRRPRGVADVPRTRLAVAKDMPAETSLPQETRCIERFQHAAAPPLIPRIRPRFDAVVLRAAPPKEAAKQCLTETGSHEAAAPELAAQIQKLQDSNKELTRRLAAAEAREAELRGKVDGLIACCETARNEAATSMDRANRAEATQDKLRQELGQICEASKKQLQHRIDLQTRLREALRDAATQSEAMKQSKEQLQTEQDQRSKVEAELEKYRALSSQALSAERQSREALLAARSRQADELERRVQAHSQAREASQQADRIRRWSSHMSQLLRRIHLSWQEEADRSRLSGGSDVDAADAMRSTRGWLTRAEELFEQVCKSAEGLLPEKVELPEDASSPLLEVCESLLREMESHRTARVPEAEQPEAILSLTSECSDCQVSEQKSVAAGGQCCWEEAVDCEAWPLQIAISTGMNGLVEGQVQFGKAPMSRGRQEADGADDADHWLASTLVDSQG